MNAIRKIFATLFFGFILFPWINHFVPIVKPTVSNENRALSKFPATAHELDKLPLELENYLVDRLSTRTNMIRFYNQLNIFVFKSSPANIKAFIGKIDWLYFSGEELKTFSGIELFKENELLAFKTEMLRRQKVINSYNAKLIIAFVPNKANIYPEYMPEYLIKSDHYGYGRQMQEYLKENGLPMVDLYTALEKSKGKDPLYFKTDNHWNDLGAFIAANCLLKIIQTDFSSVKLLDLGNYPIAVVDQEPGDVAKMLSIEDQTRDENHSPTPINGYRSKLVTQKKYPIIKDFPYPDEYETVYQQQDTSLPRVLIIRDSFAKRMLPYLAEECNTCTAIWDNWHYGLNEDIIKDTKPDFVIYLISESQLKNVMKYQTTP